MCLKYDWDEETGVVRTSRGPNGTPELRLLNMGPSFLALAETTKDVGKERQKSRKHCTPSTNNVFSTIENAKR